MNAGLNAGTDVFDGDPSSEYGTDTTHREDDYLEKSSFMTSPADVSHLRDVCPSTVGVRVCCTSGFVQCRTHSACADAALCLFARGPVSLFYSSRPKDFPARVGC